MELAQIEAFLVLSEELHFGHTAERLHVSQPRVSRLIASLESEVGAALAARTSRRVALTPLGSRLRDELAPAYSQLTIAMSNARTAARSPGPLCPVRLLIRAANRLTAFAAFIPIAVARSAFG